MTCIQCNGRMELDRKTKSLHPTKKGDSKFRIRIYKCVDCEYTETVYGSQGIDSQLIEKTENKNDSKKID